MWMAITLPLCRCASQFTLISTVIRPSVKLYIYGHQIITASGAHLVFLTSDLIGSSCTWPPHFYYLAMIGLLNKATRMVASIDLQILLRLRPYPTRGHRLLYSHHITTDQMHILFLLNINLCNQGCVQDCCQHTYAGRLSHH